ncbi:MAG: anti-sigma F factor [Firmicutes bacterium]|nr:anti-sigma F factor [Clostridiales bacterium]MBQ4340481.1 anti-sigma F factor [Bacillota bacterium]
MQADNKMVIEFDAVSENESFARAAVAAFVAPLDPTVEELTEIKTALSEAVTNSVIHGYEGREGVIKVACSYLGGMVEICVEDQGEGIENVDKAKEPLYTSKPEQERSGMGFTVMEIFMDKLTVESAKGKGTKVIMMKQLGR